MVVPNTILMAFKLRAPILLPAEVKSTEANVHIKAADRAAISPTTGDIETGKIGEYKIILVSSFFESYNLQDIKVPFLSPRF